MPRVVSATRRLLKAATRAQKENNALPFLLHRHALIRTQSLLGLSELWAVSNGGECRDAGQDGRVLELDEACLERAGRAAATERADADNDARSGRRNERIYFAA